MLTVRRNLNATRFGSRRTAFTLMELMIVVAILAMIAAMAAPQLMSLIRESAVFREADKVREWMGETRRFAVDTGINYEFRYELNGSGFVVLPSEQEINIDDNGSSTTTEKYVRIYQELDEDIQLKAAEGADEQAETIDAERFGDLDASKLSRKTWSAPIIFSFDGTAQDFELRVADADGLTAVVKVRGLTGSVSTQAANVYQEED